MADYSSDIVSGSVLGAKTASFGKDEVWWLDPNIGGLDSVGVPIWRFPLLTAVGHVGVARLLVEKRNLFVFAGIRGDDTATAVESYTIAVGNGGKAYQATLRYGRLVKKAVVVTAVDSDGIVMTLQDDGLGAFGGDGLGSVDYETGEVSVVFDRLVPAGHSVVATYEHYGRHSTVLREDAGKGDGSKGPYQYTVEAHPVLTGSFTVTDGLGNLLADDGKGSLVGSGSGTIDYETGEATWTFSQTVPNNVQMRALYRCAAWPEMPTELNRWESEHGDDVVALQVSQSGYEVSLKVSVTAGQDAINIMRVGVFGPDGELVVSMPVARRRVQNGTLDMTMRLIVPEGE